MRRKGSPTKELAVEYHDCIAPPILRGSVPIGITESRPGFLLPTMRVSA